MRSAAGPTGRTAPLGLLLSILLLLVAGCASQPRTSPVEADPLEPVNRVIYQFNDGLDTFVLRPFAAGYAWLLPQFMRTGINNFFNNLNEPRHFVNNMLQGKPREGLSDAARLFFNSTVGLAGLLDVATEMGMERHIEDLGQTFGVWGIPQGPYLVLPLLGPRTTRHAVGTLGDWVYHPQRWLFDSSWRDKINILWFIHTRSTLLNVDDQVALAFDEYAFVRDAYLQNRKFLLFDGNVPDDDFEDEFDEEFDDFEEFEEFDEP